MRTEEKASVKNSIGRLIFVALAVLVQAAWLIFQMMKLNEYSTGITLLSSILAIPTPPTKCSGSC